jgi:3-methyladenine DNA glycosylase AlkD
MPAAEILRQLESLGSESYRRILKNHGAADPMCGVKISELKKIHKANRGDQKLAMELYASGNYDAQYLAGLMADETRMSKADLKRWLKTANSFTICGTIVAAVAAESAHGEALAAEWIESKNPDVAQTGWTTWAALVSVRDDGALDLPLLKKLLGRVEKTIHQQPDRVRYAMNNFVIALGSFVAPLTKAALTAARKIGPVECDMGETSCQVFPAVAYIQKVQERGTVGKKRKAARC